jgi:hypothetical protein
MALLEQTLSELHFRNVESRNFIIESNRTSEIVLKTPFPGPPFSTPYPFPCSAFVCPQDVLVPLEVFF